MNSLQALLILAHFLTFVVYLLLIGFVLYKNPRAQLNRLCSLGVLPFAIWTLALGFMQGATTPSEAMLWLNIAAIGWCSFPITALWFYLSFARHGRMLKNPIFMTLSVLIAIFFTYQQWSGHLIEALNQQPYGWSTIWANSALPFVFFTYYFILIAICIYLSLNVIGKAARQREKKQARLLCITPMIALALGSATDVILPVLRINIIPPVACITILVWGGGLAYAITRYGLMTLTPRVAANKILSTMSDSLMLLDQGGKVITANSATLGLLEYREEELLGKEFTSLLGQPETSSDLPSLQLTEQDAIYNQEVTYKAKSGKSIPVLLSASALSDEEGESIGFICLAHDITDHKRMEQELRESEEKYRTLVNHALVGIGIHQDGKIVYANEKLAAMLGYTREEGIGLSITETIQPDERNMVIARAQRRQAGGNEPRTYEIRLLKKDSGVLYALISNAIIEYAGRKATLITVADIGDTKARKELEQSNKELEAFTYSVSHDLRAPLRSMDGFSQALLEDYADKLDAQGKDYLHRVRAASQRMGELIDDLLALSRVGRTEMRYDKVDLSNMAGAIMARIREKEPERQVEFVVAEGLTVDGDKNLLRAVMENLLGNAWKFTGKHEHARIEFGLTQREGGPVYFVCDDGAGFDMAYVDKLFRPFQRLHDASEFPGTGIGLSTVQRIIHRHGGDVWAEGALEKGATFYFTLPR